MAESCFDGCWADPLSREERAELAAMLARHCNRLWEAAWPARTGTYSDAEYAKRQAMTLASNEMADLRLDVTERAKVAQR